jgi:hypothetical protein
MDQQKPQGIRLNRFHGHHYRGSWHFPSKVILRRDWQCESTITWTTTFVLLELLDIIEVKARVVK